MAGLRGPNGRRTRKHREEKSNGKRCKQTKWTEESLSTSISGSEGAAALVRLEIYTILTLNGPSFDVFAIRSVANGQRTRKRLNGIWTNCITRPTDKPLEPTEISHASEYHFGKKRNYECSTMDWLFIIRFHSYSMQQWNRNLADSPKKADRSDRSEREEHPIRSFCFVSFHVHFCSDEHFIPFFLSFFSSLPFIDPDGARVHLQKLNYRVAKALQCGRRMQKHAISCWLQRKFFARCEQTPRMKSRGSAKENRRRSKKTSTKTVFFFSLLFAISFPIPCSTVCKRSNCWVVIFSRHRTKFVASFPFGDGGTNARGYATFILCLLPAAFGRNDRGEGGGGYNCEKTQLFSLLFYFSLFFFCLLSVVPLPVVAQREHLQLWSK